jgi:hypothetical protein
MRSGISRRSPELSGGISKEVSQCPSNPRRPKPKSDDDDLFVERNGKRIAKRGVGRHAKQWISLEPGFVVYGDDDLVIEQHGAALH